MIHASTNLFLAQQLLGRLSATLRSCSLNHKVYWRTRNNSSSLNCNANKSANWTIAQWLSKSSNYGTCYVNVLSKLLCLALDFKTWQTSLLFSVGFSFEASQLLKYCVKSVDNIVLTANKNALFCIALQFNAWLIGYAPTYLKNLINSRSVSERYSLRVNDDNLVFQAVLA